MIKYHILGLRVKFLFILFVFYGYANAQSLRYSHNLERDNIDQILTQADNVIKKRTRLHCPYCMGIGRTPYGTACGYCGARGYYIDEYKEKQKNIILADSLALCANRLYEKRKFKAAAETYYSVIQNWVKIDYLHNEMIGLSTEERNSFWNQRGIIYDRFYSLCHLLRSDSALNSTLYNSILQTKGILLHTEVAIHDLVERSQDEEIRQIYNLWKNLRDVFYMLKPLKTDERIIDIDTIGAVKDLI